MDFKELRKEYETQGIDDSQLDLNPIAAFKTWLQVATENAPGPWFETNAMTLATAGTDRVVTSRTVLLKGVDEDAIRFYTNYDSTKGKQIAENPNASVTFHWAYLGRQVQMRGAVIKTSREDSEAYFRSRPRGSQLGALASQQSSRIASQQQLETVRAELETKFEGKEIPLPENWGGYSLMPSVIEFWQGRLNRMHDRVVYQKNESATWERYRISP